MTDKEVMLWQVAQYIKPGAIVPVDMQTTQLLVNTLRAALAQPEPEPVAWMYVNTDGECEQIEYGEPFDDPSVTPLYAALPQRKEWNHPDCEGECIACLIEREVQNAYGNQGVDYLRRHVTAPPQREWQGLTDEEVQSVQSKVWGRGHEIFWFENPNVDQYTRAIEQALKEKNK